MTSRVLCGVFAVLLAGLIWASVDDPGPTAESRDDSWIERPLPDIENRAARAGRRAGSTRNPGGLPARGGRAGGRRQSAPAAAAASDRASSANVNVAAAPSPQAASIDSRSARLATTRSVSPEPAGNTSAAPAEASASADGERPRSRGIGGSVLERNGAPAAGLTIGLKARRVFGGAAASASQTTTDGRGNFAFGAVADGEYEIRTEKNDRYESAAAVVRAGTDSAVLVVEPASQNMVLIHGVVQGASGAPLEGVRINAIGVSITAVTDAKGAYALRLPAGERLEQTSLQFRRTGYRDRRWAITEGLRSGDYDVIGNVRLEPVAGGVAVSGVVMSTSGTPVARAQVQLDSAAGGRGYRGLSDGAGRFTLANVEAASDYRLWVRPQSGFKDAVLEHVLVDAAMQPLDVEVVPIGVATLRARMVTPDGASVPGFTMWLTSAYGGGPRSLPVTSDGQGRLVVADLPEGPVTLQTRAAPVLSVSGINMSASTPAASDITVPVDVGPHRLDGVLLTRDGAPAAGLRVSLEWSASSGGVMSRSSRETTTNSDGSFVFTQLGGGVHTVSATLAGAGSVRVDHRVGAGNQPVQIALPGRRGTQ